MLSICVGPLVVGLVLRLVRTRTVSEILRGFDDEGGFPLLIRWKIIVHNKNGKLLESYLP